MCGIIGIIGHSSLSFSELCEMIKDSSDRGQDSTGATIITRAGEVFTHSVEGDFEVWVERTPGEFIRAFQDHEIILVNNRAQPVPEGDSSRKINRQPVFYGDWVAVHNGTFGNDREVKELHGFVTTSQIDSEVGLALLDKYYHSTQFKEDVLDRWSNEIVGGMAFIAYNLKDKVCFVAKNFKPLCYYQDGDSRIWVSEAKTLKAIGRRNIKWVPPYNGFFQYAVGYWKKAIVNPNFESSLVVKDDKKVLVVTSGGIDSTTAAYIAKKVHHKIPHLLHFNYGQIASEKEMESIRYTSEQLGCTYRDVDIRWLGTLADTPLVSENVELPLGIKSVETTNCWVPARNLVMLSIAAAIAESEGFGGIYSGFNLEESGAYPDNDVEFLKVFNLTLKYGTLTIPKLILALERLMKPEIIKLGDYLGVPFDHTWSCDRGGEKACGECGCCWMRQHAFIRAGVHDGQTYLNPPQERPVWFETKNNSLPAGIEDILSRVEQKGLEDIIE